MPNGFFYSKVCRGGPGFGAVLVVYALAVAVKVAVNYGVV